MPANPEQNRLRLTVMQNALRMIGLHHPSRIELKDTTQQWIAGYPKVSESCSGSYHPASPRNSPPQEEKVTREAHQRGVERSRKPKPRAGPESAEWIAVSDFGRLRFGGCVFAPEGSPVPEAEGSPKQEPKKAKREAARAVPKQEVLPKGVAKAAATREASPKEAAKAAAEKVASLRLGPTSAARREASPKEAAKAAAKRERSPEEVCPGSCQGGCEGRC